MAILTPLTLEDVTPSLRSFGVEAVAIRGLLAGSVNSNFEVTTKAGSRFFARLYEEQDAAGAAREASLLARLAQLGVPVVRPLERDDAINATTSTALAIVRGKPMAVFPFAPGVHRCQRSVSVEDVRRVGASLAKVHVAGESIDAALTTESRFRLDALTARLRALGPLGPALEGVRSTLYRELDDVAEWKPASSVAPLIHGDLFRDNVLFDDSVPGGGIGSLRLLDFESASRGLVAFDVMVTLLAYTFDDTLRLDLGRALLEGYRTARELSDDEREDLFGAGLFACARFTSTRLTDYELRPRGVGVYKDFRRWVHRRAALVEVGASQLVDALGLR